MISFYTTFGLNDMGRKCVHYIFVYQFIFSNYILKTNLTNVNHVGKNDLPSNQGNAKYFSVTL